VSHCRFALLVAVWSVLATGWLAPYAYAQDRARIVGQVFVGTEETSRKNLALFREAFRELGYVVNARTIKAHHLVIPPSLLALGDQVIE
jgi:hypothetical protein